MNSVKALIVSILLLSASANAALVSRLGGLAYYDTETDLTWLADATYAQTSGYNFDGLMNWDDANTWVTGLVVGGVGGWRLPNTIDVGNDGATYTNLYKGVDYGYNITTPSELSNMYYNVLGNVAYYDTAGNGPQLDWGLANTGPFINVRSDFYWSSTEYAPNTADAWGFSTIFGVQKYNIKTTIAHAWAVQSGDVAAVPIPATAWLFGSALMGLAGIKRRKA